MEGDPRLSSIVEIKMALLGRERKEQLRGTHQIIPSELEVLGLSSSNQKKPPSLQRTLS